MKIRLGFGSSQARVLVFLTAFSTLLLQNPIAFSQSLVVDPVAIVQNHVAANLSPLDGRQFRASIVAADNERNTNNPLDDRLFFNDGKFSSAMCSNYNFSEAPYWIRVEDDQIHFLAELKSPTDGTMVWEGTIQGDSLDGTMRWTKDRWYWTIEVEHRIRGKLENLGNDNSKPE